ncbi:MAG: cyclic nucleotide-binding domain-containing protein [Alphaproteobacteria bacterium]|jgi:CRP-like cAMP-binding protein|nr:cyclic nucleotide-binding domain-containing protein [Alphaproteobacteria bacterium]MDP6515556.1 cyclic nucleotide-binding domain-containing protein [Alphaproteobacteria bacterium]|tara:strand:+ start:241 stop:612 length:372 start_codon:yes stop_codon:yes gene_type:complete
MDESLDILERRNFIAGTDIFKEGDPGDVAYMVESGEVMIWHQAGDGQRQLGAVRDGGIFGEMALIDDQPRMATATAFTDTVCVAVPKDVFQKSLGQSSPFLVAILRVCVRNIRSMNRHRRRGD